MIALVSRRVEMLIRILRRNRLAAQIAVVCLATFACHVIATVRLFDRNGTRATRRSEVREPLLRLLFFFVLAHHGLERFAAELLLHQSTIR